MRTLAVLFGAASVCTLAALASAQQLPTFNVGDSVDYYTASKWIPCTVTSPLKSGIYNIRCGSVDLRAKNEQSELRVHIASTAGILDVSEVKEFVSRHPLGDSIGARYATREPRTCDNHRATITSTDAKELFICDAEHEFGGTLYLVSDVSLLVSNSRPYSASEDSGKVGIDTKQQVFDISATYNNYQCSQIPSSFTDYPGARNCNEFKMTNAAGSCYKNTAGEWHCLMYDFHPAATATATATNVAPPTIVE